MSLISVNQCVLGKYFATTFKKKNKYFAVFDGHVSYTLFFISIISNEFHNKFVIWIVFFSGSQQSFSPISYMCMSRLIYLQKKMYVITSNRTFKIELNRQQVFQYRIRITMYVHISGTSCWCWKIKNLAKTHC
jgi:hypothetical protein